MFKKVLTITLCVLLILSFAGCSKQQSDPASNDSELETITLRLSHIGSPEHPWQKGLEKFVEKVNKDTNGQVVIEIYPNASLSENNERTMVEQCQIGTLDMALFPASQGGNMFAAFSFPFQFESRDVVYKMLTSDIALEMMDEFESKGIKGLAYWENGFRQFTNNVRPIKTPEDFKGLKIRAPQVPQTLATLQALGANAMSVSLGELYVAMQQGLVDGQENPLATIYNERFYEVQKYCTVLNYAFSPQVLGIHVETYNKLPENVQKVLVDAAQEMSIYTSSLLEEQDATVIEKLKEVGTEVHVCTPEEIAQFKAATNTEALREKFREIVGADLMDKFTATVNQITEELSSNK